MAHPVPERVALGQWLGVPEEVVDLEMEGLLDTDPVMVELEEGVKKELGVLLTLGEVVTVEEREGVVVELPLLESVGLVLGLTLMLRVAEPVLQALGLPDTEGVLELVPQEVGEADRVIVALPDLVTLGLGVVDREEEALSVMEGEGVEDALRVPVRLGVPLVVSEALVEGQ